MDGLKVMTLFHAVMHLIKSYVGLRLYRTTAMYGPVDPTDSSFGQAEVPNLSLKIDAIGKYLSATMQ